MKFRWNNLIILLLFLPGLVSCKRDHYKVNTSGIKVDIKITRLEKDLFTVDPADIPLKISGLKNKYKSFLQIFSYVINTGDINDPAFNDLLVRFCTDRQNNEVYKSTIEIFPSLDGVEKDLENAFSHYLYYYPGRKIPSVFSCITGFNASILTISGDSVLGIGLDRYLGSASDYYKRLGIYSYISAKMAPQYIVPDCIYGWGSSEWDFDDMSYPEKNVLSRIVHEGKLKYFEKCMLPDTPDEILFGFNPEQLKFCQNNESQMWLYLVENDLVFKTDQFIITKLIGEAPFTSYFTNESPGRAAVWIGFRIVESFMIKNPGTNLGDMMNNLDIQGILEKAKYNPK